MEGKITVFLFAFPFLFGGFLAPVVGGFIDKYGMRTELWLISCIFPILGFGMQVLVDKCDYNYSRLCQFYAIFPLVMITLFYSIVP